MFGFGCKVETKNWVNCCNWIHNNTLHIIVIQPDVIAKNWPLKSNISYDKVQNIVKIFSSHPSVIIKIKPKFKLNKKFSFQCVSEAIFKKVVGNLPSEKTTAREIPVNVLKISEICLFDLTNCRGMKMDKFCAAATKMKMGNNRRSKLLASAF